MTLTERAMVRVDLKVARIASLPEPVCPVQRADRVRTLEYVRAKRLKVWMRLIKQGRVTWDDWGNR